LEIEGEKEAHSTRIPAVICVLHAVVVIPMAAKDCFGFMSHMGGGTFQKSRGEKRLIRRALARA
jgi:hypothetical protein